MKTMKQQKAMLSEFDSLCNLKIGRLTEDFDEGFTRVLVETEEESYTGLYYRVS